MKSFFKNMNEFYEPLHVNVEIDVLIESIYLKW